MPVPAPQTVEQMIGEDVTLTIIFPDDVDVTGAEFGFLIADSKTAALAPTATPQKTVGAGITIDSPTQITIDLTDGSSAALTRGCRHYACRRLDVPDRAVAAWGPWIVAD